MVALIAATGLRIGELLALRWGALDLDQGTLTVRSYSDVSHRDSTPCQFGTRLAATREGRIAVNRTSLFSRSDR